MTQIYFNFCKNRYIMVKSLNSLLTKITISWNVKDFVFTKSPSLAINPFFTYFQVSMTTIQNIIIKKKRCSFYLPTWLYKVAGPVRYFVLKMKKNNKYIIFCWFLTFYRNIRKAKKESYEFWCCRWWLICNKPSKSV